MADYVERRNGGYYLHGSRVSLDSIVYAWLQGATPEAIRQSFPSLNLEQIYGSITYYLANKQVVDAYLIETEAEWDQFAREHPVPEPLREKLRRAEENRSLAVTAQYEPR